MKRNEMKTVKVIRLEDPRMFQLEVTLGINGVPVTERTKTLHLPVNSLWIGDFANVLSAEFQRVLGKMLGDDFKAAVEELVKGVR